MAKTPFGPVNRVRNVKGQAWFIEREDRWHLVEPDQEGEWWEAFCERVIHAASDRPAITFQERWVIVQAVCPDCYELVLANAQKRRLK